MDAEGRSDGLGSKLLHWILNWIKSFGDFHSDVFEDSRKILRRHNSNNDTVNIQDLLLNNGTRTRVVDAMTEDYGKNVIYLTEVCKMMEDMGLDIESAKHYVVLLSRAENVESSVYEKLLELWKTYTSLPPCNARSTSSPAERQMYNNIREVTRNEFRVTLKQHFLPVPNMELMAKSLGRIVTSVNDSVKVNELASAQRRMVAEMEMTSRTFCNANEGRIGYGEGCDILQSSECNSGCKLDTAKSQPRNSTYNTLVDLRNDHIDNNLGEQSPSTLSTEDSLLPERDTTEKSKTNKKRQHRSYRSLRNDPQTVPLLLGEDAVLQ